LPSRRRRGEVREGRAAEIGKGCHAGIRFGCRRGERFWRGGKVAEGEQRIGQRIGGDFGGRKVAGGEGGRRAQRIRHRSGLGGGTKCQTQLQRTKRRTTEGIGSGRGGGGGGIRNRIRRLWKRKFSTWRGLICRFQRGELGWGKVRSRKSSGGGFSEIEIGSSRCWEGAEGIPWGRS
jgi:hypothetical protein